MKKIAVYAKIMRRHHNDDSVLDHLNYWMNVFSNTDKYDFYICSKNIALPSSYKNVYTDEDLLKNIECKKLKDRIDKSFVDNKWKGAAFGLCSPYFFLKDYDYVFQLDADDIKLRDKPLYYIEKAHDFMVNKNLNVLSYDMYNSIHNHWSFGICLGKLDFMKEMILKTLYRKVNVPGWGINIDHMVDMYLKSQNIDYVSFMGATALYHGGSNGLHITYLENKNKVEINYYNKRKELKPLSPRTILLR